MPCMVMVCLIITQLGGKGANLAEMSSIGLSVPPGFTVSTEACKQYQDAGSILPAGLWAEILDGLQFVEEYMGATLGDPQRPLLLSVRSGAAVSMPGMMDTVLNLGLNDEVAAGLAAKSGERFAYDSFRRFLDMFGNVVSVSFLASGLLLPAIAAELTPTQHVVGSISVRFVSFARIASTAHP
jgi:phosphoenolpyruvate synthase/pyruvate phosphate dikinase